MKIDSSGTGALQEEKAAVRTVCRAFEKHLCSWSRVVDIVAELDALHSLAEASRGGVGGGDAMCRPVLLRQRGPSEPAQLYVQGMRHPYLFRDNGQRCVPVYFE